MCGRRPAAGWRRAWRAGRRHVQLRATAAARTAGMFAHSRLHGLSERVCSCALPPRATRTHASLIINSFWPLRGNHPAPKVAQLALKVGHVATSLSSVKAELQLLRACVSYHLLWCCMQHRCDITTQGCKRRRQMDARLLEARSQLIAVSPTCAWHHLSQQAAGSERALVHQRRA